MNKSTSSHISGNTRPEGTGVYYAAKISVPITLPPSKTWVPPFNTYLISRIYTIAISLKIHSPGTGVPTSTISLRLPVQIAFAGNPKHGTQLIGNEVANGLAISSEFSASRSIKAPDERFVELKTVRRILQQLVLPRSPDNLLHTTLSHQPGFTKDMCDME